VFGTYQPPSGQTVWNLLSEGIVEGDATPGPNAYLAEQYQASDPEVFSIHPTKTEAFSILPQPKVGGPENVLFPSASAVAALEPALESADDILLTEGGTGIPGPLDTRFPTDLPNDPFQITSYIPYDSYSGSPVQRFFQMRQQLDCSLANASAQNPAGCAGDLFPWVEVTVAAGSSGKPEPSGFKGEGAIAMGFYNNSGGMRST
jgi:phospholipase C